MPTLSLDGRTLTGRAGVQARIDGDGLIPHAYGDWEWLTPTTVIGQARDPDRLAKFKPLYGTLTDVAPTGVNFIRAGGGRYCYVGAEGARDSVLGPLPAGDLRVEEFLIWRCQRDFRT